MGFLKGMKEYSPLRSAFAVEPNSDGAFEVYAEMGSPPWPRLNGGQPGGTGTDARTGGAQVGGLHEGGPITVLGGNERSMTVYNQDWDIPIGVHHNAINDARIGSLEQWARTAGARFEQHKDYLCFNALNAGAGTTYGNSYDGVTFFNASHIDPGAEYQTAQSNVNTSALSPANFNTVYIAASKFLDDRGQPVGLNHSLLIHAVDLRDEAAQITKNQEKAGTGNRDVNPNYGMIRALQAPGGWLDSTAWFIVDDSLPGTKPIGLQVRQGPMLVQWDDHANKIRYFQWEARYTAFYLDWRLCVQGNT
jgi:phage major head subunit gpT-like protein